MKAIAALGVISCLMVAPLCAGKHSKKSTHQHGHCHCAANCSCRNRHPATLQDESYWHAVARLNKLLVLQFWLKSGKVSTDVNLYDPEGRTMLHLAAAYGHGEMVALLLEYGANMLQLDNNGALPIELAVANGHEAIAEMLFNAGQATAARRSSQPSTAVPDLLGKRRR